MARQKPILTHSRMATAIGKADASPEAKKAALGRYAEATRAARGDAGAPVNGGVDLAKRIKNAREKYADIRDAALAARTKRVHNARMQHQGDIRTQQAYAPQKAALQPRKTERSLGRERTGVIGYRGGLAPVPSARVDSLKRYSSVGVSPPALGVKPIPSRG
jgi:hypothetical protein